LLPQISVVNGHLEYHFNQPAGITGITYGAECSDDLQSWSVVADEGAAGAHVFRIPLGLGNKFLRLKVTQP
jgi:hypothetical protein